MLTLLTSLPTPVDVLGLPVTPFTRAELVDYLAAAAVQRDRLRWVAYVNAHVSNLAEASPTLRADLLHADALYADGQAIVLAARALAAAASSGRTIDRRHTAPDYQLEVHRRWAEQGTRVYLLGGRPGVAGAAAAAIHAAVPAAHIVGTHDGYFGDDAADGRLAGIVAAAPQALVTALDTPRQQRLIVQWTPALQAAGVRIVWPVGAALDFLAGAERRAPAWLRNIGGEWLGRLLADPRGKAKRYLVGNTRFTLRLLRAIARMKTSRS